MFLISAGTIHAIGSGAIIAETQENSNVTYRVYDYGRRDKNGNLRELHFNKAIDVLNLKAGANIRQKTRHVKYFPGCSREILYRCEYFEIERICVNKGFSFSVLNTLFQILMCLEGSGGIETPHSTKVQRFKKGDTIFIPADTGRCHIIGDTTLLKIRC